MMLDENCLRLLVSLALIGCGEQPGPDGAVPLDSSAPRDAGASDDSGADSAPPDAGLSDAGLSDAGLPDAPRLSVSPALVDDAMGIPIPTEPGSYNGAGPFYGRNGPVMIFLTLLARDDPSLVDSSGASVLERASVLIRGALSPSVHPLLAGGHASWMDQQVPLALAVARRTPVLWATFTDDERGRADILMRHALHVANIFCNTNSARPGNESSVRLIMGGGGSGYLPNQSAAYHAYAIGSYVYFGGPEAMNSLLAMYNNAAFQTTLRSVGFNDIADLYAHDETRRVLEGERVGGNWPDPMGVRKPFRELNTLSLERSMPGTEHPYNGAAPLPATPGAIFRRWGHDFTVGAMPPANVGPSARGACGGHDAGSATGTLPYEDDGRGMLYEFNSRSSGSGPHTRSSWDYASWGMQQYMFMFSTVTMLGYWDRTRTIDDEVWTRARRAVEIYRYIGENGWYSTDGPPADQCNSTHHDGYHFFSGLHWAQGLMDAILFSDGFVPPSPPVVP